MTPLAFHSVIELPHDVARDAKRAGLTATGHSELYEVREGSTVVGYTGFRATRTRFTLKTSFVLPEHRGRGIYARMLTWRLAEARRLGYATAHAALTPASLPSVLRHGARITRQYKNGVTDVEVPL